MKFIIFQLRTALPILLLMIFPVSCKKAGPGGDSVINVRVVHHSTPIPGATVYLKYNAKEFPGEDPAGYDESFTAGSDARGAFDGLMKGNYYLFATGYDSTFSESVSGGVGVRIDKNGEVVTTDVPVTESGH